MPRPTKLNVDTQAKIIQALEAGATVQASCDYVGISTVTYYNWINRGTAEQERRENNGVKEGTKKWESEQIFLDFFNEATRAQAEGLVNASVMFRAGMNPSKVVTDTTVTNTETRLRRIKHADGTEEQVPYEYVKREDRKAVTYNPGDWRAAMEYLARRDPDNWARQKIVQEIQGKDGQPLELLIKRIDDAKRDLDPD